MAETSRASILLIYTGGTIGMKTNPETGALSPFDFNDMYEEFPYLRMLNVDISVLHFKPIDSSNVTPALWIELARLIRDSYASFDGFVVLHGTDTMAYSASALSFMIENLGKPVVFTGSQIPIGVLRTDGRENLITAIEIAAAKEGGRAAVAVILLDFQSLKNVAPRHNPNEFGSAFGLRFVFKSRPAMKKILLMVALASLCASVSAQKSADRKAARAAQKEYYRALDARMHDSAMKALQDSAFILKADKVTFRRGRIAYVSSTTNFVSMEGERAVIQLAFPNLPWPGANGLGGITVDGIVTNVSVKTDKKGFVRYQMSVVGSGTSSWMAEIVLNPLDNKASVTVYPTYSSNRVTLSGELVPYDRRSVYKGRSLF